MQADVMECVAINGGICGLRHTNSINLPLTGSTFLLAHFSFSVDPIQFSPTIFTRGGLSFNNYQSHRRSNLPQACLLGSVVLENDFVYACEQVQADR